MKIEVDLKDDFEIIEDGTKYTIPQYTVEDGVGIVNANEDLVINLVRGSKRGDEDVEKRTGTLHEHLLAVMVHDLKFKHELVPSHETATVITLLEHAQMTLLKRQIDRSKRNVLGTYQK